MAKKSYNDIPNLSEDWALDKRNGLPYAGESVQKFIKKQLEQIDQKVGHVTYEAGKMNFYDNQGGSLIGSVAITGTSYVVKVQTNTSSNNLTVLTGDLTYPITLTPTTAAVEFGSSVEEDFFEDYTFSVEVDDGSGYVDKTPENNNIREGSSVDVDIRNMLKVGLNKVRINVRGVRSEQTKSNVFFVTLTSLSLSCDHQWNKVWFEGEDYYLQGIFLAGNVEKTLSVKVGDKVIEKTYSPTTQYVTVPTNVELEEVPAQSGIIPVEMWLGSEGAQTKTIRFNLMYVSQADKGRIALICTNNVKEQVYNFREEVLLEYATYNITSVKTNITAAFEGREEQVLSSTEAIYAETKYPLQVGLKIDTTTLEGIVLTVNLSSEASGVAVTKIMAVDNSYAFIPTEGYKFYMNASLGSNESEDREKILNSAPGEQQYYDAVWELFGFKEDAWTTDPDGNKALFVPGMRRLTIPDLKPFVGHETSSATFEVMFRVPINIGVDFPLFHITDTNFDDGELESFVGLVVTSSKIILRGTQATYETLQSLPFSEDRIHHIAIVFQNNYAGTGQNLARVFINGCENVTFSYTGQNRFYTSSNCHVVMNGASGLGAYYYMMRVYDKALESNQIFANFLNSFIEATEGERSRLSTTNSIIDGNTVSYDLCKAAGLNCLIVETPNDGAIPSYEHQKDGYESGVNFHLEYADNPEWNVSVYNVPLDRQGTTSKLYYRANLRSKIDKEVKWEYPNVKDSAGKPLTEMSKTGYFDGQGNHPRVQKITWKKNVASQPQGHKMGATGFYNDLYKKVMGGSSKLVSDGILPNEEARVAVYQHPFMGFHKKSDGTYEFIGLYTGGPDKTDKQTFGYNETASYPSLMMIEGPNHDPLMTRFLVPWVDVFYDAKNETLSIGDPAASDDTKQEGWDADIVAGYSTGSTQDASAILNLYVSEFKPAYEAIYYNSPYIASLAESGWTLEQINADVSTFRRGTTGGHSNSLLTFYNTDYELVYYRIKTKQYEVLPKSTHDMLAYLNLSGSPTTETILTARASNWAVQVGRYVNLEEAYYRQCFAELIGATDNDAKNSYWRKFRKLSDGGKWGFNEDDLDTIFLTDNNGQDTKSPYIEPDDLNANGGEIFQGRTSAFWYGLRNHQATVGRNPLTDMRKKMQEVIEACQEIAGEKGIYADTIHETVYKVISHYFWDNSSKYFPATAYNEDTKWAYIDVWQKNPNQTYNSIPPLTQIHGDHLEAESEWVTKRLVYIFSKYQVGAFAGSDADGFGVLQFTPAEQFTLQLSPFVDLYPCVSAGGSTISAGRTRFGETADINIDTSETTGLYIKALDWYVDLGDLSGLALASRSGGTEIAFAVNAKRLSGLTLGSYSPADVKFNATSLTVEGDLLRNLYAKNVSSLKGVLSLTKCPSLTGIDCSGTSLSAIYPKPGSLLESIEYPDTLDTLFLADLPVLADAGISLSIAAQQNIRTLYIENCDNIDPLKYLSSIMSHGNINEVGLKWKGTIVAESPAYVNTLTHIAKNLELYTGCEWDSTNEVLVTTGKPIFSGTIDATGVSVYEEDIALLQATFPELKVLYSGENLYLTFEDPEVQRILAENYGDGTGLTPNRAATITSLRYFSNTDIQTFDDLWKLPNVTNIYNDAFSGCASLRSIDLSNITTIDTQAFDYCSSLKEVNLSKVVSLGKSSFRGCTSLTAVDLPECTTLGDYQAFYGCKNLQVANLPRVQSIPSRTFGDCSSLTSVSAPLATHIGDNAFSGCTSLTSATFGGVTTVEESAFNGCINFSAFDFSQVELLDRSTFNNTGLVGRIELPKVKHIGYKALTGAGITEVITSVLEEANEYLSLGPNIKVLDLSTVTTFFEKGIISTSPQLLFHNRYEGANPIFILRNTEPPVIPYAKMFVSSPEGSGETDDLYPEAIYVPDEAVEAYQNAEVWSELAQYIKPLSEYTPE